MHSQSTAREPIHCYVCHHHTDERCSYCLLPICSEHGQYVQPWFTRRQVPVCTPCQAQLEAIARQEQQSLPWVAYAQQQPAVVPVLTSAREGMDLCQQAAQW